MYLYYHFTFDAVVFVAKQSLASESIYKGILVYLNSMFNSSFKNLTSSILTTWNSVGFD